MTTTPQHPPTIAGVRVGQVTAAVLAAWTAYVLVGGLSPVGRHFVILGALRLVLFGALLAFARLAQVSTHGLGRVGLVVAAVGAVGTLVGGVAAVTSDGWSFDPFAPGVECTCAYAYVIGLGGVLFALGTLLVGIAGRSMGWLAYAVVLGGVLFPAVFVLQPFGDAVGHLVWLTPWAGLAAGLILTARADDGAP